ncbi:DUF5320 domain-containing protein [Candidatus Beckwithbacteria bacterium]|nr:DUF5320 domain-containing protein [Candidatus Beckwithbacteria bacterium]
MPNFDATGPLGQGPRTGRGLGRCNFCFGLGFRKGLGLGRGRVANSPRFWGWIEPSTKESKLEAVKNYRQSLEEEMKELSQYEKDLINEEK